MDNQAKKEYLSQYKYILKEIDRKTNHIKDLRDRLGSITSNVTGMPRGKGNIENKMETCIAEIDEHNQELLEDIKRLLYTKGKIERSIEKLEDKQLEEILKGRYIDCKTFEAIAYENFYSWRWVHQLHTKALEKLDIKTS